MSSFYDILLKGTHYIRNGKHVTDGTFPLIELDYCELEIFKQYGGFLDSVLDEHKERVAHNILCVMHTYRTQSKFYSLYEVDEVKKKNEMGNKIKSDLRKVKSFRGTLKSFKEDYHDNPLKRIKELRRLENEVYGGLSKKRLLEFEDMEAERLNRFEENELYYEEYPSHYYTMIDLIDMYIVDLETRTFKIAKKRRYIDTYVKPSRTELKEYLHAVCKDLELKNCANNAKNLIKELNKNC